MKFYFHPQDEELFKIEAVGKLVRTIVFDTKSKNINISFTRKVNTLWSQTCKNNIETDRRIKALKAKHYQVYSWVCEDEKDFALPSFSKFK